LKAASIDLESKQPGSEVLLRIRSGVLYFTMDVHAAQYHEATIPLKKHDLGNLNDQLRAAIEDVALNGQSDGSLRELAKVGHFAFERIFDDPHARTLVESALEGELKSVQIVSEDFPLAWELLYPSSIEKPLSFKNFWGMRHIISRIPWSLRPRALQRLPQRIEISSVPTLGLLADRDLPNVLAEEVPFFDELNRKGKIVLLKLPPLEPEDHLRGVADLRTFLDKDMHVAHFACHAECNKLSPDQSTMRLSNSFLLSIQDFTNHKVVATHSPLVILNACDTADLNPLYTSYFADALLDKGARGVVATECEIPDTFAAPFAKHLYGLLLGGIPLGVAMLRTRQHFLEPPRRDPSGLVYSMYAYPQLSLRRKIPNGKSVGRRR
jgi:CHAT domain-containing protein